MSTGAGPFTYYSSDPFTGRSSSRRSSGPTKAQLAQADKEREFHALTEVIEGILNIHRVDFPPAQKPEGVRPPPPDAKSIYKEREKQGLVGVSRLKRRLRKEAKVHAREKAAQDLLLVQDHAEKEYQAQLLRIHEWWTSLNENNSEVVIATVDAAFEDNQAPAVPVGVEGSTLSLVMLAPPFEETLERW
jgi:hypothetical protein